MPGPSNPPFKLQALDHVVVRADDYAGMVAFYRDVIGCTLEREVTDFSLTQLRAGDSLIDIVDAAGPLGKKGGASPDHDAPNMDHFCVQVLPWDAETILEHLRAHGATASSPERRYGALGYGPSIYVQDPEGNTLELKGPPSKDG
ncbi:MAG: VOC family protein [Myxococcota bacterium]